MNPSDDNQACVHDFAHLESLDAPADFEKRVAELGIELAPTDLARLGLYLACLLDANTRMNLTAIREPEPAWEKHIFDALTLVQLLAECQPGAKVADVGSGGGVPALPLAIVFPELNFTCIEATAKKVEFLRQAIVRLGLTNACALQARAEQAGQDRGARQPDGSRVGVMRGAFDVVTARAVGHVAVIAELCIPLAKVGGLVVLVKGQRAEEELTEAKEALHLLGARSAGVVGTPTGRLVVLEKQRETPRTYPRRDGEPKRVPLGMGKSR